MAFWLEPDHLTSCFSSNCLLPSFCSGLELSLGEEGGPAKLDCVCSLFPGRLGAKTASRLGVGRGVEIKLLPITTAPTVDLGGEEVSWTSTGLWVPGWKYSSPVLNSARELPWPQVSTQPVNHVQGKCYLEVRCIKTVGRHEARGCSFSALHPDSQAVPKRALTGTPEGSTPPYSSSLQ